MKHSLRKSHGQMYNWVSHVWSPIRGCSHQCSYCYVRKSGDLPEIPVLNAEDFPDLGRGRTIFVGHMCDMFSAATRDEDIYTVLNHCRAFDNEYVFQTKNLRRLLTFAYADRLPTRRIIGTTVETNRADLIAEVSKAPPPSERIALIREAAKTSHMFITIEPILDFDVDEFAQMIWNSPMDFVNIGADSKGHGLKEPSKEKLLKFISLLQKAGVEIRAKENLERILG